MMRRLRFGYGYKESGYMTLEAALILGIVMQLMAGMFCISFYLHDRAVLYEITSYYAETMRHMLEEPVNSDGVLEINRLEEQNLFRTNGYGSDRDSEEIVQAIRREAGKRLLVSTVTGIDVGRTDQKIVVTYEAVFHFKIAKFILKLTGIDQEIRGTVIRERTMDPEEFIRLCRGVVWRKRQ